MICIVPISTVAIKNQKLNINGVIMYIGISIQASYGLQVFCKKLQYALNSQVCFSDLRSPNSHDLFDLLSLQLRSSECKRS